MGASGALQIGDEGDRLCHRDGPTSSSAVGGCTTRASSSSERARFAQASRRMSSRSSPGSAMRSAISVKDCAGLRRSCSTQRAATLNAAARLTATSSNWCRLDGGMVVMPQGTAGSRIRQHECRRAPVIPRSPPHIRSRRSDQASSTPGLGSSFCFILPIACFAFPASSFALPFNCSLVLPVAPPTTLRTLPSTTSPVPSSAVLRAFGRQVLAIAHVSLEVECIAKMRRPERATVTALTPGAAGDTRRGRLG